MKNKLTHYDAVGEARMVDVSAKPVTRRTATARAYVAMAHEVIQALPDNKKGDPLQVARIAGISAAKKTSELIPLCHAIALSHVSVQFTVQPEGIEITATAATCAQTGVEMEALTAASVAALTIYDMTKALDKAIEIRTIHLLEKTGGKSGAFRRGK
jgi:cyclic pyranopterin phosphate synthase